MILLLWRATKVEKELMSTREAAAILGVSPQMVRARMITGEWDLGTVLLPSRSTGRKNRRCYVSRAKLARFLGQGKEDNEKKERTGAVHSAAGSD